MLKQKEYKIADTNLANFGTPLEREVKKAAAESEEAWKHCGREEGLHVWRIEQFNVVSWPQEDYGTFYVGDSYIVLNSHKKEEKLMHDVHFWLGSETTQDEAGTAAYKTVELDTLLDDVPVQHREVEAHESSLFCSYFKKHGGVRLLEGGVETGFTHVEPTEYKPRLLWIKGKANVRVTQVPMHCGSLNQGDVFVLDNGLELIQWQGEACGAFERGKAATLCRALDDERGGKPEVHTIRHGETEESDPIFEKFFGALEGDRSDIQSHDAVAHDLDWEKGGVKKLFKLSDASGELTFSKVAEGKVKKSLLDTNDVFVLDVQNEVFIWVGRNASEAERKHAMGHAQQYLQKAGLPSFLPITRVMEGGENETFESYLDGEGFSTPSFRKKKKGGAGGSPMFQRAKKAGLNMFDNETGEAAASAYEGLAEDDKDWLMWSVDGGNLVPEGDGSGGRAAFVEALPDDGVRVGILCVQSIDASSPMEHQRQKYVFVSWSGPSVSVMKRSKLPQIRGNALKIFGGTHAHVDARDKDALSAQAIGVLLLKTGGAHPPTSYDFGAGESIETEGL